MLTYIDFVILKYSRMSTWQKEIQYLLTAIFCIYLGHYKIERQMSETAILSL